MLTQRSTLFSKASYRDPSDVGQALAETKCYYLHAELKQLSERFHAIYEYTRDNPIELQLKRFNQLLITRSRTEAILAGEKLVITGRSLLSTSSAKDRYTALLVNLSDPKVPFRVETSFAAVYVQTNFALEETVNLPFNRQNYNDFSRLICTLSECNSFLILRKFLDKQTPAVLLSLKHLLHYAFYQAIHFGDEVMVEYLLNHGVDANDIYRKHSIQMISPLTLVLTDLECCVKRMEQALQAASRGDVTLGTTAELHALFATRLASYKTMLRTLLDKGADADKIPNYLHKHKQTPRELALSLLDTISTLETSDYLIKDYAEQLRKLITRVADAADIEDYQPVAASAEPAAKKQKP